MEKRSSSVALNCCWHGMRSFWMKPEKAALYYENLLLYDEEYPVVYGEYGMFLIRTGQKEARKLWEDYQRRKSGITG